ncbi:MAG: hypothetical protein ACLRVT_09425, partial [Oscillospiraceae bacterium]
VYLCAAYPSSSPRFIHRKQGRINPSSFLSFVILPRQAEGAWRRQPIPAVFRSNGIHSKARQGPV